MTAVVYELFAGRTQTIAASPLKAEVEYIVRGATSESEVETAALAEVPASETMNGTAVARTSLEIVEQLNVTTWKVKATYTQVSPNSPAALENTYTFDIGGGTQNIKTSYGQTGYAATGSAPRSDGINMDDDSVKGVDIVVPQYQWSETYWFSPTIVDTDYKKDVAACVGTTNDKEFRGFAAGEVLFMGASGNKQGNGWWQITFKFAREPNTTNIEIGGSGITVASKKGWEYLWVRYEDDVIGTGTNKAIVKTAKFAYVEHVYQPFDWTNLDIGY